MANEPELGQRANKGAQMASFFENPMFQEAMEQVHGNLFKAWCETTPGLDGAQDREEMHRIYIAAKTLDLVFRAYVKDGDSALATIKAMTVARTKTEGDIHA